jgi:hypothetical protein
MRKKTVSVVDQNELKKKNQLAEMALNEMSSYLQERRETMRKMGQYFGGQRDLYNAMGWKRTLTWDDYYQYWRRHGVGKRVILAYPEACWRYDPAIVEAKQKKASAFNDAIIDLNDEINLFFYMQKVDVLSRIGQYGVLYLGFDDGKPLSEPVTPGAKLMYVQAFHAGNAPFSQTVSDIHDPRYGKPEYYNLVPNVSTTGITGQIHWQRCIHVAENCEGNDVWGTPCLEGIYNYLQNLEMISGAATEGYYRGGFNGLMAEIDKEVEFDEAAKSRFKEQMQLWLDGYDRAIAGKGVKFAVPQSSVALPTAFAELQFDFIASDTRIPKRILKGSEVAEVASTQDSDHFNNAVDTRRQKHCTVNIVRNFVNRMIDLQCIPAPTNNKFKVIWPDLEAADDLRNSQIAWNKAKAIQAYTASGAQKAMPFKLFCKAVLSLPPEDIEQITDADVTPTPLYSKTNAIPQANP